MAQTQLAALREEIEGEKRSELASEFDSVHTVERALQVGSVHDIVRPENLRPLLIDQIRRMG